MIIVSEAHINDRWKLSSGLWKILITRAARASIWISQGADWISTASATARGTDPSPQSRSWRPNI
jgi:hypothetical protein